MIPTSLVPPVDPLVVTTSAIALGTWQIEIDPNAKAGPVPIRAAANLAITGGMGPPARQRSSLDEFSIATVG